MKNIIPKATDPFRKFILFSLGMHVFVVVLFNVKMKLFPSDDLIFQSAVRVDMVALPEKIDKMKAATKKLVKENKKKEKSKKKKKKAKTKSKKKKSKPKKKSVNLKKEKSKQNSAIEQLKALEAIENIKNEEKKSTPAKKIEFKGNRLSSGSQLEGLNRIQFEKYYDQIKNHLYNNWSIPQWLSEGNYKAQALAVIDNKGNVTHKKILTSSGNDVFDATILKAIEQSSPFPQPPDRLKSLISGKEIVFGFPEN